LRTASARTDGFQGVVLRAETLTIANLEMRPAVGALDDVICDHTMVGRPLRAADSALIKPFAPPPCSSANKQPPLPMLRCQQFRISALRRALHDTAGELLEQGANAFHQTAALSCCRFRQLAMNEAWRLGAALKRLQVTAAQLVLPAALPHAQSSR
jgi:hypothetical protein